MGYSATAKACMVLDTFKGGDKSSNVWAWKGHRYMYERGRENADGAITGSVIRMDGKRCGSFRIDPDGQVIRAPHGMGTCMSEQAGRANYLRRYDPHGAWAEACKFDGIPADSKFAAFSSDNPYA